MSLPTVFALALIPIEPSSSDIFSVVLRDHLSPVIWSPPASSRMIASMRAMTSGVFFL